MITGDPPRTMNLRRARLTGAVLVQAYIAADLADADLSQVNAAYARFNQTCFAGTDLSGARMYEASCVKTEFTGARTNGCRVLLGERGQGAGRGPWSSAACTTRSMSWGCCSGRSLANPPNGGTGCGSATQSSPRLPRRWLAEVRGRGGHNNGGGRS